MTYVVLARKWRPQTFSEVVGQNPITRTLENAIRLNRVSHALLFTGARGVGKTTTARIVAKALNCEKGPTIEPCGSCSNCHEIAASTSVDVLEIDGASNTHVEDVRELIENVRYTPSKSKHKLYIIDEVHMLSKSAFNALLKTLEEPPSGVIFIFATTEPQKIPDTILSRCQRFDFIQISESRIAQHLRKIADAESLQISDAGLAIVARESGGSLRDALSAVDRVIAFCGNKVSEDDVAAVLGLTDRELITKTLEAFVRHDAQGALDVLDEVLKKGFDLKSYLLEVWGKVRDLLVLKGGGQERLVHATADVVSQYREWLSDLREEELERWFDLLRRVANQVGRTEFPRYLLEVAFLQITREASRIPLAQLVERLEALESRLTAGTTSKVKPAVSSGGGGGSVRPKATVESKEPAKPKTESAERAKETIAPDWSALVAAVKRQKPAMAGVLLQAINPNVTEKEIVLFYDEDSFYVSRAQDQDFQAKLREVADQLFGGNYVVQVKTQRKQASNRNSSATMNRSLEREALGHPTIRRAVSLFDGKVEEIKPHK